VFARRLGFLVLVTAFLAPPGRALAADAQPAPTIPGEALKKLDSTLKLPRRPKSRQEYVQMLSKQMAELLKLGEQIEKDHATASNLHLVQIRMLVAADFLVRSRKADAAEKQRLEIARRLLASNAPVTSKVTADYFVTLDRVRPGGAAAKDAAKEIRSFIARYGKTTEKAAALVRGVQLTQRAGEAALGSELLDTLEKDHAEKPTVSMFLRSAGRKVPFVASLTLLDGKKLTLPGDLMGKVVVVDFWATWCPPCIASLPHMKQLYAKVKDKGVEFVGISLDRAGEKQKVTDFVKQRGLSWLHAYSGGYWGDPTARKYGINSIPSVWVIGKDGKIFSEKARADLEGTINRALAEPGPKPPTQ